jgi:hypothetical protein
MTPAATVWSRWGQKRVEVDRTADADVNFVVQCAEIQAVTDEYEWFPGACSADEPVNSGCFVTTLVVLTGILPMSRT